HNLEYASRAPVRLWRPPWVRLRVSTIVAAQLSGLRLPYGNVDSLDHKKLSARDMMRRIANFRLSQGDILMFHDDEPNPGQWLRELLKQLNQRGLPSVALDPIGSKHSGAK